MRWISSILGIFLRAFPSHMGLIWFYFGLGGRMFLVWGGIKPVTSITQVVLNLIGWRNVFARLFRQICFTVKIVGCLSPIPPSHMDPDICPERIFLSGYKDPSCQRARMKSWKSVWHILVILRNPIFCRKKRSFGTFYFWVHGGVSFYTPECMWCFKYLLETVVRFNSALIVTWYDMVWYGPR